MKNKVISTLSLIKSFAIPLKITSDNSKKTNLNTCNKQSEDFPIYDITTNSIIYLSNTVSETSNPKSPIINREPKTNYLKYIQGSASCNNRSL